VADSNKPGMDKALHFVCKMDAALALSQESFDDVFETENDGYDDPSADSDLLLYTSDEKNGNEHSDDEELDEFNDELDSDEEEFDDEGHVSVLSTICKFWESRRVHMISDWTIAGWMLSVVPEIRKDAIDNATGWDQLCVEHVIEKLFHGEAPQVLGQKKVTFWIELDGFQNKGMGLIGCTFGTLCTLPMANHISGTSTIHFLILRYLALLRVM